MNQDIIRCHADVPLLSDLALGDIPFQQLIREIAADIEFGPLFVERETTWNFLFTARSVRRRERNGIRRLDFAILGNAKHFDRAVDIT